MTSGLTREFALSAVLMVAGAVLNAVATLALLPSKDFAVTPEQLIADQGIVVAVTRYTGIGKETGKELDLPVVHIWDVRDRKVTRFRQFADTARFLEVVPTEAATTA